MVSPLPPPNYPPSPEQPDFIPVGTEAVDEAEESSQQDQMEDVSSSTEIDKAQSSSVLREPASVEQEAVGETSSTIIPRPKPKVNSFILLTHFLVSLLPPFLPLLSLTLLYPIFSSSLIDYCGSSFSH